MSERNPAAAARVLAAIDPTASLLADYPRLGRRESRGLGRVLVVPRYGYVISYRIEGETVEVRYILHPRQARRRE